MKLRLDLQNNKSKREKKRDGLKILENNLRLNRIEKY